MHTCGCCRCSLVLVQAREDLESQVYIMNVTQLFAAHNLIRGCILMQCIPNSFSVQRRGQPMGTTLKLLGNRAFYAPFIKYMFSKPCQMTLMVVVHMHAIE
jgi:hypothetical protein